MERLRHSENASKEEWCGAGTVCEGLALPWLLCRWAEPWSVLDPAGDVRQEGGGGGKSDLLLGETPVTKKKPRSILCVQQQRLLLRGAMQVSVMRSIPLHRHCLVLVAGDLFSSQTPKTSQPASVGKGTPAAML